MHAIYVMKSQTKLLAHKTCYSAILEYFLKDKSMKDVVSEMYAIATSSTK